MTTSHVDAQGAISYDKFFYGEQVNKFIHPFLYRFDRLTQGSVLFNLIFLLLLVTEVVTISYFFTFLIKSSYVAFGLASVFLTLFGYFILRLYFQTSKIEKLKHIEVQYTHSFKKFISYQEGIAEHHMALANACSRFSETLSGRQGAYYRPPRWLGMAAPQLELFSEWCHAEDLYKMRELLLLASLEEHIKLVRCEPTSLEIHAALANAYVMLSSLYSKRKNDLVYDEKFRETSEKAIEEFKIICDYAPNEPWVHLQLAYSYHDLNMPLEEIDAYETILRINPDDKEVLFKLGTLYFQQGMNAKGLRVYEELKRYNFKKAETLIKFYGTHIK